jgi:hypothetical protein
MLGLLSLQCHSKLWTFFNGKSSSVALQVKCICLTERRQTTCLTSLWCKNKKDHREYDTRSIKSYSAEGGKKMQLLRASAKLWTVKQTLEKYLMKLHLGGLTILASRLTYYLMVGRVAQSVQRVATGLDGPGIESRWGRDFTYLSKPALGPPLPPVQWVPGISRG